MANEVSLGRVAGPFHTPQLPLLYVSSFGVIPKKGQPDKWHLIVDLSSPGGASVNDGIDSDEFTLHYISVDQVIRMVSQFGKGALMTIACSGPRALCGTLVSSMQQSSLCPAWPASHP